MKMKKWNEYLKKILANGKRESAPQKPTAQRNVSCGEYVIENGVLVSLTVKAECVVIPEGVDEIKPYAINYDRDQIRELVLPSTLRYIRRHNFSSCGNLESIHFPEGLLEIGEDAFARCKALKQIVLPDSLRKIGGNSFYGCESLEQIQFGSGLRDIPETAFSCCRALKELVIPGNISYVGKGAFYRCPALKQVIFSQGVEEIGEEAFSGCYNLAQVEFHPGLLKIGNSAFWDTKLGNVVLPEGLQSIGKKAFSANKALQHVFVPASVTQIGKDAFSVCPNLRNLQVSGHSLPPLFRIENGVLLEYTGIADREELVIPEGVTEIQPIEGTIKRIVLPESLRKIGKDAFRNVYPLEEVALLTGVTEIGDHAFYRCALRSVVLPENLRILGSWAFDGCANLESVVMPRTLSKVPFGAFVDCTSLTQVDIPDSVTEIGGCAFEGCKKLESVKLPQNLQSIGSSAFMGCVGMRKLELPETLVKIESETFKDCGALADISLPKGLRELGKNAFSGCKAIRNITIPEGVQELKKGTFSGCTQLQRIVLPQGITRISRYAFDGCENLEYVECADPERFENALIATPFWSKRYPNAPKPVRLPPDLVGNHSGQFLRERGYTFFDPSRNYTIDPPGEDGVVEVHSWCSEDAPDEDGFGREDYYDWWYLDEALQEIPGVSMLPNYSHLDRRNNSERFAERRQKAAEIIRRRKQ